MHLNSNEIVSTSESGSILSSDIPKPLANSNAEITLNPEVHIEGEKSSCLESPSTQSNAMPTNANEL